MKHEWDMRHTIWVIQNTGMMTMFNVTEVRAWCYSSVWHIYVHSRLLDFRLDLIRCHSIAHLFHLCFAFWWAFCSASATSYCTIQLHYKYHLGPAIRSLVCLLAIADFPCSPYPFFVASVQIYHLLLFIISSLHFFHCWVWVQWS